MTGSSGSRRRRQRGSVRRASASTCASRLSSLAPAGEKRSRKRSSCLGLMAWTQKPRSIRLSTTGPCGTSMATDTASGAAPVCLPIQAAISARPSPPWANPRSPTLRPWASITNTWCVCDAQSTPTNQSRPRSSTTPSIGFEPPQCLPIPVLALEGADSPQGIHRGILPRHGSPPGAQWLRGRWVALGRPARSGQSKTRLTRSL